MKESRVLSLANIIYTENQPKSDLDVKEVANGPSKTDQYNDDIVITIDP